MVVTQKKVRTKETEEKAIVRLEYVTPEMRQRKRKLMKEDNDMKNNYIKKGTGKRRKMIKKFVTKRCVNRFGKEGRC